MACASIDAGFKWEPACRAERQGAEVLHLEDGRAEAGRRRVSWGPIDVVEISSYKELLWQDSRESPISGTMECDGCHQRHSRRFGMHRIAQVQWLCSECFEKHLGNQKVIECDVSDMEQLQCKAISETRDMVASGTGHTNTRAKGASNPGLQAAREYIVCDASEASCSVGHSDLCDDVAIRLVMDSLKETVKLGMCKVTLAAGLADSVIIADSCTECKSGLPDQKRQQQQGSQSQQCSIRRPSDTGVSGKIPGRTRVALDTFKKGIGATLVEYIAKQVSGPSGIQGVLMKRLYVRKAIQHALASCLSSNEPLGHDHKTSKRPPDTWTPSFAVPSPVADETTHSSASQPKPDPNTPPHPRRLALSRAQTLPPAVFEASLSASLPSRLTSAPNLATTSTMDLLNSSFPLASMTRSPTLDQQAVAAKDACAWSAGLRSREPPALWFPQPPSTKLAALPLRACTRATLEVSCVTRHGTPKRPVLQVPMVRHACGNRPFSVREVLARRSLRRGGSSPRGAVASAAALSASIVATACPFSSL